MTALHEPTSPTIVAPQVLLGNLRGINPQSRLKLTRGLP
jgi:hypothetical protein